MAITMQELYRDNKDEDGFLYLTYASQEMFGSPSPNELVAARPPNHLPPHPRGCLSRDAAAGEVGDVSKGGFKISPNGGWAKPHLLLGCILIGSALCKVLNSA